MYLTYCMTYKGWLYWRLSTNIKGWAHMTLAYNSHIPKRKRQSKGGWGEQACGGLRWWHISKDWEALWWLAKGIDAHGEGENYLDASRADDSTIIQVFSLVQDFVEGIHGVTVYLDRVPWGQGATCFITSVYGSVSTIPSSINNCWLTWTEQSH